MREDELDATMRRGVEIGCRKESEVNPESETHIERTFS